MLFNTSYAIISGIRDAGEAMSTLGDGASKLGSGFSGLTTAIYSFIDGVSALFRVLPLIAAIVLVFILLGVATSFSVNKIKSTETATRLREESHQRKLAILAAKQKKYEDFEKNAKMDQF